MGKLHLNGGVDMEDHPQAEDFGFDYSFIMPGGFATNHKVETVPVEGGLRVGKMYPDNYWRNGEPIGETDMFSAELVTEEVLGWLDERNSDNPFFLYVPYSEVHTPVASPQKYLDMYSDHITDFAKENPDIFHFDWVSLPNRGAGEYYANISYLDAQVGRVLEKLDELNETDNTIIIFASDNGPVIPIPLSKYELRSHSKPLDLRQNSSQ